MRQEKNYDFRKRLLQVHRKNVRDSELLPNKNELEIKDGFAVILPDKEELRELGTDRAGDPMDEMVIETAARDFVDYLFVSMGVSAMVTRDCNIQNQRNSVRLKLSKELGDASSSMSYRITVGSCGENQADNVLLEGYDAKGLAQGLYHLEDRMNLRMAPFLERGIESRKTMFTMRACMSAYGVDLYPDEYLSRLAHEGITTICLWIKDLNKTKLGYLDFNDVGYRAARYGINIYVSNYLHHSVHPDDDGAQDFYDELYGRLLQQCPYIKGFKFIGEACQFSSRDPRVGKAPHTENFVEGIPTGKISPGWWPCNDWPDLMRMIRKAVDKHDPTVEIILSSYNWGWAPEEERVRLINSLPENISIMATWEMFEHYDLDGCDEVFCDYSIRSEGPGKYFLSEAKAAAARNITVHAITNSTGRTWDFGAIPYMPAPYQWIKRYEKMREAYHQFLTFRCLQESHHFGVYPSFVTELEKWAFTLPPVDLEDTLRKILAYRFGKENLESVDKALRIWSEAFTYIIPTNEDQYGAFRIGPSYPFWMGEGAYPPQEDYAMFKAKGMYFSHYTPSSKGSPCSVRIGPELKSLQTMRQLLINGLKILEGISRKNEDLTLLINMGWFMYRTTVTGIHQKQFYISQTQYEAETDRQKKYAALETLEQILIAEQENAESTIPLVQMDSVLGYEPSMEYVSDERRIRWKLRQVKYQLECIQTMKEECFL